MNKSEHRVVWSFFSGAMGLDLGLAKVGLSASIAVEKNEDCIKTIRANHPELLIPGAGDSLGDVTSLSGKMLREQTRVSGDVFLMVGGPPCQSFSTGGNRAGLGDPRGNLIYHYLRLVDEVRPRYFVLENVANLVTAALRHRPIKERPGQHWSLKKYSGNGKVSGAADGMKALDPDEMSGSAIRQVLADMYGLGYQLRFGVLNAADFGAPQNRMRFILVGSRGEAPPPRLPAPTHGEARGLHARTTLRDAIWDLRENPGDHSVYTEDMARFFRLVPPGGTWRDLPKELHEEALGGSYAAGGGKTGFFRRLSWDSQAPTLTGRANRKGSAICHPEQVRPLSVRECARVQGFPDDWVLTGSMSSQYLQIGNAVPTHLGSAIGTSILAHASGEHAVAPAEDWEHQLERAVRKLRSAARNKRPKAGEDCSTPVQQSLFDTTSAEACS